MIQCSVKINVILVESFIQSDNENNVKGEMVTMSQGM